MRKEAATPPLTNYFGIDLAANVISEAKATLNTHDKDNLSEVEQTVRNTLVWLAEQLNIQNCDPIVIAGNSMFPAVGDVPKPATLEYNLKTGELFQKLPTGQKLTVENPLALVNNAETILESFKGLAIASLPAS